MDPNAWVAGTQIAANFAQIAAVLLALVGFGVALRQLRISAEANKVSAAANKAMAWLQLRQLLLEPGNDSVHRALRDRKRNLDVGAIDAASLDAYLGVFEHLRMMLDDGLIDWPTFQHIYGYRIGNIMAHPDIVKAKLIDEGGWDLLRDLIVRLKNSGYPLANTDLIT